MFDHLMEEAHAANPKVAMKKAKTSAARIFISKGKSPAARSMRAKELHN